MLGSIRTSLRVLLLDGEHRQALAMVRSLGRRRARVSVASTRPYAPALLSRYCAEFLQCPDASSQPAEFKRWLLDRVRREHYDTVLFCSGGTAEILATQANTLRLYCHCAVPQESMLLDLARPRRWAALFTEHNLKRLGLGVETTTRPGANDYALVAVTRRGEPVATFVHRLRAASLEDTLPWFERGATRSVEHEEIRRAGLEILRGLRWEGIASLGFRQDADSGTLSFLGLHPAWGDGLELGIASGIDLPWIYAQFAAGNPITGPTRYRVGTRCVRLITPVRHSLRRRSWQWLTLFRPDVRTDWLMHDPLPAVPSLGVLLLWFRRAIGRRLRRRRPMPQLVVIPGGNPPKPPHLSSSMPTSAGGASP